MLPLLSTPVVGIDRLRNDCPGNCWFTPTICATGCAGVNVCPWSVDLTCMSASSWLSYQVTYTSPFGATSSWHPSPEIAPFWLSWIGVLSPGATPPHVLPPSVERSSTTCWL